MNAAAKPKRNPPRSLGTGYRRTELHPDEIQEGLELSDYWGQDRPKTRADCGGARPCPFVSCRYHLYLDVRPTTRSASIRINFPDLAGPLEMEWTCALDEADGQGEGMTLEQIGKRLNVTRERVRQIEVVVLGKLRPLLTLADAWDTCLNRQLQTGPDIDEQAVPF